MVRNLALIDLDSKLDGSIVTANAGECNEQSSV